VGGVRGDGIDFHILDCDLSEKGVNGVLGWGSIQGSRADLQLKLYSAV
jgi:hypothetical protein